MVSQSMVIKLLEELMTRRGTGSTTQLIGLLFQNPDAVLIVGSYHNKKSIMTQFPLQLGGRVFSVDDVVSGKALRGRKAGPVHLDISALSRLITDEVENSHDINLIKKWIEDGAELIKKLK